MSKEQAVSDAIYQTESHVVVLMSRRHFDISQTEAPYQIFIFGESSAEQRDVIARLTYPSSKLVLIVTSRHDLVNEAWLRFIEDLVSTKVKHDKLLGVPESHVTVRVIGIGREMASSNCYPGWMKHLRISAVSNLMQLTCLVERHLSEFRRKHSENYLVVLTNNRMTTPPGISRSVVYNYTSLSADQSKEQALLADMTDMTRLFVIIWSTTDLRDRGYKDMISRLLQRRQLKMAHLSDKTKSLGVRFILIEISRSEFRLHYKNETSNIVPLYVVLRGKGVKHMADAMRNSHLRYRDKLAKEISGE